MKNLKELLIEAAGERSMGKYAEDAGISRSLMSLIVSGRRIPSKEALEKLTSAEADPRGGISYKMLLTAAGYSTMFRDRHVSKTLVNEIEGACLGKEGASMGTLPEGTPDTPVSIEPDFVTLYDGGDGTQQEMWNYVIADSDGSGAVVEFGELISGMVAHRKKNRRSLQVIVVSRDAYDAVVREFGNKMLLKFYISLYDKNIRDFVDGTEI